MAALLSGVNETYSEPSWARNLVKTGQTLPNFKTLEDNKNNIIKFPSLLCFLSNMIFGKKVFLYQKLFSHLKTISKKNIYYDYEYFLLTKHNRIKITNFDNEEQFKVSLWANRIYWMLDSENVIWVDSKNFFKNVEDVMFEICIFFDLDKIKDFSYKKYHVKKMGMNNSDIPLNMHNIKNINQFIFSPNYEIDLNTKIEDNLRLWVEKKFKDIPQKFF